MKQEGRREGQRISAKLTGRIRLGVGLFLCLVLIVGPVTAQQEYEYPGPFPGAYLGLSHYPKWYYPPPVTASPTYPTWSPDGESLAFAAHGRIWMVPVEGGTATQLTSGPGYHSQPDLSPDGRYLAYSVDVAVNFDIYILDRQTGEAKRITDDPHIDVQPRWSPDGSRVLFTTFRSGTFDLWAYDMRKGSAEPIVSHPNINNQEGDWIGNGGDLVFVSKRGEVALGSGSLWRWNSDREEAELLLRAETNFQGAPVVSPHGGTVAYVTDASGSNDLYAVPSRTADGGIQPVRLTHTATDEYFPAWSPDGQRIVYARNGGTPDRERTIDSGMGFALYTVTRGGGEPKPVRINGYAWSVPTGVVQVHVTESGSQLPSRIYLRGADGLSYFPDTSFPRVSSVMEDYYFHTDGSFEVMLPVGQAELEVWRGFEYEPVSRTVNVRAGEVARVEVELTRWIDMAADGWYSGDNHIHPNYGGHELIMPMDLRNKARAEDLNVANGMIANYWGNSRIEDLQHFLGHPHPHTGPRTVVYYNEEYRSSFFGHMSLLNLTELITPAFNGSRGTAYDQDYPANAKVLQWVHEQGGIGGYVHPFGLDHRSETMGTGRTRGELPVDAILGLADFMDVVCIWSDELGSAEVWYRLLNTGSRVTATGGTDVMSDISRHPAVGTTRSYVYTGEDKLDYDSWADALAAGQTFATSGPILTLDVSGKGMGQELQVSKGDVVKLSATARSIFRMHRLEVIQNGTIIHTVEASGEAKKIEAELEVRVESSGWLAVRVLGPTQHGAMDSYLFAHTSPVYVIADGEPIHSSEDAAFFVRWIDQNLVALRDRDNFYDPAHREEVISTFEEGRRLYQLQVDGRYFRPPGPPSKY